MQGANIIGSDVFDLIAFNICLKENVNQWK